MVRSGTAGQDIGTATAGETVVSRSTFKRPRREASIADVVPGSRRQGPFHEIRISPCSAVGELDPLDYRLSMGHNILEEQAISRSRDRDEDIVRVNLRDRDIGLHDIRTEYDLIVSAVPVGIQEDPIATAVEDHVAAVSATKPIGIVSFSAI